MCDKRTLPLGVADTLADIDAQLAEIDSQLTKPEFTQFADRSTRRRPTDDLITTRNLLLQRRAQLATRPRQFLGVAGKGLC